MKWWMLWVGLTAAIPALALDEGTLGTTFSQLALPYFQSAVSQSLSTQDGVTLHYRVYPAAGPSRGTILLVNGQSEYMPKYAELLYDMRDWGYDIVTYDHRGQGESQRLIADSLKGYVGKWQDYVDDLDQVMRQVVLARSPQKVMLMAHSMGGGIAADYLIHHPGIVSAFVASSPMWEIRFPWDLSQEEALDLANVLVGTGFGEAYAPGKGPTDWQAAFSQETVTGSAARYAYAQNLMHATPSLIISGPTDRWVQQATLLTEQVRANAAKLSLPMLIFAAGKDTLVLPAAEQQVVAKSQNGSLHEYPSARHEIFMEVDAIRSDALTRAKAFLDGSAQIAGQ